MTNFTAAEAKALFTAVQSYAQELAIFQVTETHDPWAAPSAQMFCSITLGPVRPVATVSGLSAVSLQVTLLIRVWTSAMQKPLNDIDPNVLAAICALMGQLAGGFTLGETVRNVDLFSLTAQPAYVDFEGKPMRVAEITCPVIVNDTFAEVA